MSGSTLAVGSPNYGTPSIGATFILERVASQWIEDQIVLASDGAGTDRFGEAVSLKGDILVVGAHQAQPNGLLAAGAAYVFQRINGNWTEVQKLVASDASPNSRFGNAVAIDGDTIVVAAHNTSAVASFSGAVYVFERYRDGWHQTAKLVGSDTAGWDQLGHAVAVDGNRIVASSIGATTLTLNAGAAWVFERAGNGWVQTQKIFPQDAFDSHVFGIAIALAGTELFIGAYGDNDAGPRAGAVYAYELFGGSWQFREKVYPVVPELLNHFGESLAVDGSTLVVGEPSADGPNTNSGGFTVYRDTPSGWKGVLRFLDPAGEAHSHLGRSVAIWGDQIAAGAPQAQNGNAFNCYVGHVWLMDLPSYARAYCFGAGCPCGNDDPLAGCVHSGGRGATLAACGSGSVAADDATFRVEGLAAAQPVLLFRGTLAVNGGAGTAIGDGLRCAGGAVVRLGVRFADAAGSATWGPGLAPLAAWQAGDTVHLQAWYRDPTASPCGHGFNTTHALEATFAP